MNAVALGRLLIVDDEAAQMQALCNTLQTEGYTTTGYSSARQALSTLRAGEFDLLLTDLMMPEMDGIALLNSARLIDTELAGIVMTGHGTIDTAVKAMQVGALDYIQKPFRLNVVLPVIARALDVRRLRIENASLVERERRYVAELEAANRDLEAFSSSVSHDLRAPLRAVSGFTDMYLEQFGAGIPEQGRQLLAHVQQGARRMDRLIEDLLRFSRLSQHPLVKAPVDLAALVARVVADLRAAQPQRAVEVHLGPLPSCEGDYALLTQAFVNLLSNAFKFTRERSPAQIEVGTVEHEKGPAVFVRDNGAGFEMKYAGKLFGVFQRLHSDAEFEGTGVGLSIVHRIVERHGGKIWAHSELGKGATFFLTLGEAPAR